MLLEKVQELLRGNKGDNVEIEFPGEGLGVYLEELTEIMQEQRLLEKVQELRRGTKGGYVGIEPPGEGLGTTQRK